MMVLAESGTSVIACAELADEMVENRQGEKLGRLEAFMIEMPGGRVVCAVIARGGVFGLGEKLHAIPWRALMLERDRFVADIDAQSLDGAPALDPAARTPGDAMQ